MSIPMTMNPMGRSSGEPYFSLIVKPGILGDMEYGFTPYWNEGGYCRVLDWGDGTSEDAVYTNRLLTHTYNKSGTYKIKIIANCYRIAFFGSGADMAKLVYDSNMNWDMLGTLTNGNSMFYNCTNAIYTVRSIPESLTSGNEMFFQNNNANIVIDKLPDNLLTASSMLRGCESSPFILKNLPPNLKNAFYMFENCKRCELSFSELPGTITSCDYMCYGCENATLPLTSLNIPAEKLAATFARCKKATFPIKNSIPNFITGNSTFAECTEATGYIEVLSERATSISYMFQNSGFTIKLTKLPSGLQSGTFAFYAVKNCYINLDDLAKFEYPELTDISYMFYQCPNVTGSRSAFLAKCPNVTNTTGAFEGTNTTE